MKELKKQLEESTAAIDSIKADLAQRLLSGEQVPASELDGIIKVEVKLRNLAEFERVRELTSQ